MKRLALVISMLVLFAISLQATSAASFSDLTSYQKQKYWDMMGKECIPLLMSQQYTAYRTCALDVMEKASQLVEADVAWCNDSDGVDFMKKGIVKTDLEPNGIEDYVYTWNGTNYIIEGGCSDSKQYMMYFQNCSELGEKYVADVATASCVLKNAAPVIEPIGDKTVKEGEFLKFEVKASDADGDALTWSVEGLPSGAKFDGGVFEWVAGAGQAGEYFLKITVSDGVVTASQSIKITIVKLPTEFCGIVSEDTVLTKEQSPYVVKCHILVVQGKTLTIQPGVEIRFDGPYYLRVDGTLIADGTKDEIIHFTSNAKDPKPGDWRGVRFENSSVDWNGVSGSVVRNARFEYSGFLTSGGPAQLAAIRADAASPLIENNEIVSFQGHGIFAQSSDSSLIIKNNTLSKGIFPFVSSPPAIGIDGNAKVIGNKIIDNGLVNTTIGVGGISCGGSPLIENNYISNNTGVGISCSGSPLINNNTIENNLDGIFISGPATISNNFVLNNKMGIRAYSNQTMIGTLNIVNNLIKDNFSAAITLGNQSTGVVISKNTILNNGVGLLSLGASSFNFNNNNIYDNFEYALYLSPEWKSFFSNGDINLANNYWGTTNTTAINKMIFDFYDDFDLPKVIYKPFADVKFVW